MEDDIKTVIEQFVDYLVPELTAHEACAYLYLLRNSFLRNGTAELRVGKRTIAAGFVRGVRGERTTYDHVSKLLHGLEQKGCIKIGDVNIYGTLYTVTLPKDIPMVVKKIEGATVQSSDDDYFTDTGKRRELFERDNWTCQYCRDPVNQQNATLDHIIPKSKGGDDSKDNLKTCCLLCNGIKSGKTLEEASFLLLKSIQERRARSFK